jgi:pimeloyl-ACP methyl ester carboxylesterase
MQSEHGRPYQPIISFFVCLAAFLLLTPCATGAEDESVILLHGYGRTTFSMRPLKDRLEEAGFVVHNIGYPSMRRSPAELVELLDDRLQSCCSTSPHIHFVTHSLGGILVRAYLAENHLDNIGRVVMLAPPNRGSEIADIANGSTLLHAILGPTVIQLGTGEDSLPNRLPPPWYELGVIAGIDDINPIGSFFVPEPSDGTVSVASTRLAGMTDFVTVRKSHTFIMRSADVADYIIRFLRTGRFAASDMPSSPPD